MGLLSTTIRLTAEDADGVVMSAPLDATLREVMPGEAWGLHEWICRIEADARGMRDAARATDDADQRRAMIATAEQLGDGLRGHVLGHMLYPRPPVRAEIATEYGAAVLAHLRETWAPEHVEATYTVATLMIARRLSGYRMDSVTVEGLAEHLASKAGSHDRRMCRLSEALTGDPTAWLSDDPEGPWLRLPALRREIALALAVIDG